MSNDRLPLVPGELAQRLLDPNMQTWLREMRYGEDGNWYLEPYFKLAGWDVPIGIIRLLRAYLTLLPFGRLLALEKEAGKPLPKGTEDADEVRYLR